eukprot:7090387-Pyramimonas_sp.AAC.1
MEQSCCSLFLEGAGQHSEARERRHDAADGRLPRAQGYQEGGRRREDDLLGGQRAQGGQLGCRSLACQGRAFFVAGSRAFSAGDATCCTRPMWALRQETNSTMCLERRHCTPRRHILFRVVERAQR